MISIGSLMYLILQVQLVASEGFKTKRIQTNLLQLQSDISTHRLSVGFLLHKNGVLTLADNTEYPFSNSLDLKPHPLSDAVSTISIDSHNLIQVSEVSKVGEEITVTGCTVTNTLIDSKLIDSFIGASPDGLVHLTGDIQNTTNECIQANLHSFTSLYFKQLEIGEVTHLWPVITDYTFYIDQKRQFRYLSRKGAETVENQPIVGGIDSLTFLPVENIPSNNIGLNATIRLPSGRTNSFTIFSPLSKLNELAFIFDLP